MLSTFSVKGIWLPLSSQLCRTLELAVTCRWAWACLITFIPGIFANVSAALRTAAERPSSFTAILCQYLTEDIRTFADICGQRGRRRCNGVRFVLLSFSQPLLARATLHRSVNKSLLFIEWQIAGSMSGCSTNPNRNGGSSKASPINLFAFQVTKFNAKDSWLQV